jgi:peptidoglycan hydrolase-like protein with peptidoglycan-binding domain
MKISKTQTFFIFLVSFSAIGASAQVSREEMCRSVPEAHRAACMNLPNSNTTPTPTPTPTPGPSSGTTTASPNTSTPATGSGVPTVNTAQPWQLYQDLRQGSKGSQIRLLQAALMYEGYMKFARTTTSFGKLTVAAVKKFQSEYDLDETGRIEIDERDVLNDILDEMQKAGYITTNGTVKFPSGGYVRENTQPTQTPPATTNPSTGTTGGRIPICDAFGNCY